MKCIAVGIALSLCLLAFSQTNAAETDFVPGQVMVKFESGVVSIPARPENRHIPLSQAPMDETLRAYLATLQISDFEVFGMQWRGLESERRPGDDAPRLRQRASFQDWYVLHFPESLPVDSVVRLLEDREEVLIVGAHPRIKLDSYWPVDEFLSCPDTCGRAYQWAFENTGGTINGVDCTEGFDIGMREAYAIQSTTSMKVGVLDGGVDSDHDDLEANIDEVLARGFIPGGAWEDSTGHGTAVAGIVAAIHDEDSLGVCGIAGRPDAELTDGIIVPLRVLSPAVTDAGDGAAYYIDALSYVDSLGGVVPILNSSLYMATPRDPEDDDFLTPAEYAALRDAVHNTYLARIIHEGTAEGKIIDQPCPAAA